MPISTKDVVVDGEYLTESNQQRKVTSISADSEGRLRVTYLSKSANIPRRKYEIAHTKANPPLLSSFAKACSKRIK
jgi:hypothetical protein